MENPYIILIGGGTGVGTSSVASRLSSIYPVRGFQRTDAIRQVMRTTAGIPTNPELFLSTYKAYEAIYVDANTVSVDKVIEAHLRQCEKVMEGTEGAIARDISEGINAIYEGTNLLPGKFGESSWFQRGIKIKARKILLDFGLLFLNPEDYAKHFIEFVIDVQDPEVHKQHFLSREKYSPNRSSEKYLSNFDKIRAIRDYVVETAIKNNIPIVQNNNLDDAVKDCTEIITKKTDGKLMPSQ